MVCDSFLAMLATGVCLRSERGQSVWDLGTRKNMSKPRLNKGAYLCDRILLDIPQRCLSTCLRVKKTFWIYVCIYIYTHANNNCSNRHLYKDWYDILWPIFNYMPLLAIYTVKNMQHNAMCAPGCQVPNRLLSVPTWHLTPKSSHSKGVCLIMRI